MRHHNICCIQHIISLPMKIYLQMSARTGGDERNGDLYKEPELYEAAFSFRDTFGEVQFLMECSERSLVRGSSAARCCSAARKLKGGLGTAV